VGKTASIIRTEICNAILKDSPTILSDFMKMGQRKFIHVEQQEGWERKEFFQLNKTGYRWRMIWETVGLIGLLLGDLIPLSTIKDTSDVEFNRFLGELAIRRVTIMSLFDRHWANAPREIKFMESKSRLVLF
jgi:hypothetical protein